MAEAANPWVNYSTFVSGWAGGRNLAPDYVNYNYRITIAAPHHNYPFLVGGSQQANLDCTNYYYLTDQSGFFWVDSETSLNVYVESQLKNQAPTISVNAPSANQSFG